MEQSGSTAHEAREIDEVIERLHDQFPGIDRDRIRHTTWWIDREPPIGPRGAGPTAAWSQELLHPGHPNDLRVIIGASGP